ncbi:Uncharacterised protein [Mycobacterium tuberculosis]|nr:Uncharacterised protein [Mycobacterium tuberculosis]
MFGNYLVAVYPHRGRIVGDADRQAGCRSTEWIQRQHGYLAGYRRAVDDGVGFGQTVGGAQCHIGGRIVEYRLRTDPPHAEQHRRGLPMGR